MHLRSQLPSGIRSSPVQLLSTAASMIAAVNSVLNGTELALLAGEIASLASGNTLPVGVIGGLVLYGLHFLYGYRRAEEWLRGTVVAAVAAFVP